MSRIPVIIPHFAAPEPLRRCVEHVQRQTWQPMEVFVRDNDHDNVYFTAAVNEGLLKFAFEPDVEYVMVLNQDAFLRPDCVRQLVAFMQANPQCGIACPLQLHEPADGGPVRVTWGGSLQAFPNGMHRTGDVASYRAPEETYWANGAAMLIRTAMIREIGLFDRNLRFICSDSDYSFTARARGWKVYVVPAAVAQHHISTSQQPSNELARVMIQDVIYFARKWLTGDLYRSLAVEGPELTPALVSQTVAQLLVNQKLIEEGRWKPSR